MPLCGPCSHVTAHADGSLDPSRLPTETRRVPHTLKTESTGAGLHRPPPAAVARRTALWVEAGTRPHRHQPLCTLPALWVGPGDPGRAQTNFPVDVFELEPSRRPRIPRNLSPPLGIGNRLQAAKLRSKLCNSYFNLGMKNKTSVQIKP